MLDLCGKLHGSGRSLCSSLPSRTRVSLVPDRSRTFPPGSNPQALSRFLPCSPLHLQYKSTSLPSRPPASQANKIQRNASNTFSCNQPANNGSHCDRSPLLLSLLISPPQNHCQVPHIPAPIPLIADPRDAAPPDSSSGRRTQQRLIFPRGSAEQPKHPHGAHQASPLLLRHLPFWYVVKQSIKYGN